MGSNRDRVNLLFTMHSPWTAVTAANCSTCEVRAFNCTQSPTCQRGNGSSISLDGSTLSGFSARDSLCFFKIAEDCVDDLGFFTVTHDPTGYLGYFGGVTGVLPGSLDEDDPSLIRFLVSRGYSSKLMVSLSVQELSITYGGID